VCVRFRVFRGEAFSLLFLWLVFCFFWAFPLSLMVSVRVRVCVCVCGWVCVWVCVCVGWMTGVTVTVVGIGRAQVGEGLVGICDACKRSGNNIERQVPSDWPTSMALAWWSLSTRDLVAAPASTRNLAGVFVAEERSKSGCMPASSAALAANAA
jgi:hypothetical protein